MKAPIVASGVQTWRIESAPFLNGLAPEFAAPTGVTLGEMETGGVVSVGEE